MAERRTRKRGARGRAKAGDVHALRLARLRGLLRRAGISALLITRPNDIRYLTGFSGEDSYGIVTAGSLMVLSDFRFEEELEEIRDRAKVVLRSKPIVEAACEALARIRGRVIGVQSEHLSAATRGLLVRGLGAARIRDTRGLLDSLRIVKDETEIATIRKAARIQEGALLAVLPLIRPGMKESLIAARLEYEMRARGAEGTSFESIVAARANGSRPHHRAGATTTARGRPLLIDWGARLGGYCSDMTRTFCLGKWPARMGEVYRVVLEAQEAAIAAIAPGKTCGEIDAVARGIIEKAGYGERFGHGLGHGIGLDIHENPRLARGMGTVLEPGMVVTVEPGVYLPGVGGVRIEDDILVTAHGRMNLCRLPKEMEWATLHG